MSIIFLLIYIITNRILIQTLVLLKNIGIPILLNLILQIIIYAHNLVLILKLAINNITNMFILYKVRIVNQLQIILLAKVIDLALKFFNIIPN